MPNGRLHRLFVYLLSQTELPRAAPSFRFEKGDYFVQVVAVAFAGSGPAVGLGDYVYRLKVSPAYSVADRRFRYAGTFGYLRYRVAGFNV